VVRSRSISAEAALAVRVRGARLGTYPLLIFIARLIDTALAVFVIAGLIPVIVWAFRGFARTSANAVMIVWAILIAGFVYFQYFNLANP
jgi:hypothetical protein